MIVYKGSQIIWCDLLRRLTNHQGSYPFRIDVQRTGPVFVAMFNPLGVVITVAVGVIFMGETLYLGRSCFYSLAFSKILWLNYVTEIGFFHIEEVCRVAIELSFFCFQRLKIGKWHSSLYNYLVQIGWSNCNRGWVLLGDVGQSQRSKDWWGWWSEELGSK